HSTTSQPSQHGQYVSAGSLRQPMPSAAIPYAADSVGDWSMRSHNEPVVSRPARLTMLTVPRAVADVAGWMPCPIAYATMWTFMSGNAHAAANRMRTSHQNGAEPSAALSVHPRAAPPVGRWRTVAPSGSRWNALSGTTIAISSAAQTRSVLRHPSAVTRI